MNPVTSRRPKYGDDAIIEAAIDKLLPQVLEWLKDGNGEEDPTAVREDLLDAADSSNGYEFAKHLDQLHGWDVDARLVEILDDFGLWHQSDALKEAERRWVEETGQKPAKQCGDICTFDYRGSIYTGEITAIHQHGYYTVFCPILGHVREGVGKHGTILPWEKVT